MKNVFGEVYKHLQNKRGSANKSLYNALNREDVQAIILNHSMWWTEQNSTSRGLSDAQHRTLKTIMNRLYEASWLYDAAPTPPLELHHAS